MVIFSGSLEVDVPMCIIYYYPVAVMEVVGDCVNFSPTSEDTRG